MLHIYIVTPIRNNDLGPLVGQGIHNVAAKEASTSKNCCCDAADLQPHVPRAAQSRYRGTKAVTGREFQSNTSWVEVTANAPGRQLLGQHARKLEHDWSSKQASPRISRQGPLSVPYW